MFSKWYWRGQILHEFDEGTQTKYSIDTDMMIIAIAIIQGEKTEKEINLENI